VMFPSIFALGIQGLGSLTSKGSSLLIAAMVGGGVIPWAVEIFANRFGAQISLLIPSLCYAVVTCFGIAAMRRRTPTDTQIPLG
jgi:FHS family L-fucose permease-like MFS transporter